MPRNIYWITIYVYTFLIREQIVINFNVWQPSPYDSAMHVLAWNPFFFKQKPTKQDVSINLYTCKCIFTDIVHVRYIRKNLTFPTEKLIKYCLMIRPQINLKSYDINKKCPVARNRPFLFHFFYFEKVNWNFLIKKMTRKILWNVGMHIIFIMFIGFGIPNVA